MRDADTKQPLTPKYLKDYRPPDYQVPRTRLQVDLHDDHALVTAELDIERSPDAAADAALVLDGKRLETLAVHIDGEPLEAVHDRIESEQLRIAAVPARFTLTTQVRIDPANNTALEGIYACGDIIASQCEAEGFRCITWFPDRPDVLSRYRVTITGDKSRYPYLLSNGNCVEQGDLDGGRHRAVWDDPHPKPSYLFALVAGDLVRVTDRHTTPSGRTVSLELYAEPGQEGRLAFAMESLRQSMVWDEQTYGREYDLDRYLVVAVSSFNMGAMENKGLNIFNSSLLLADQDIATDATHIMVRDVVAHEYFHNWTGNRITCRDWFQLSLKEGLTVLREQQFSEDMNDPAIARVEQVRHLRNLQFPEDAGPNAHPVRPESYVEMNNFYTMTVYEKGAEVIRMMRGIVGAEGFSRGMAVYFDRHDGQAVTIEDFVRAIEDGSGTKLGPVFRRWYSQAGTPELTVQESFDQGTLRLKLSQTTPDTPGQTDKQPVPIPVDLQLLGAESATLQGSDGLRAQADGVFVLDAEEGTLEATGLSERPAVSLLRGFSAPVRLDYPQPDSDLATIMTADTDAFARWEAGQRLLHRAFLAGMRGDASAAEQALDCFAEAVAPTPADDPLLGEWLSLPSMQACADNLETADPAKVQAAWTAMADGLSERLGAELGRWLKDSAPDGPWQFDLASVCRRRLHAQVLRLLVRRETGLAVRHATALLAQADNLTDRLAALDTLRDVPGAVRDEAMTAFAETWQAEPLVMDAWYRLQARSGIAGTPDGIRALAQRDDFTLTRPNRVRALYGEFARHNFAQFHRADGTGYQLMAEAIRAVDAVNPQVAARLVTPLTRFKRLDGPGRGLMRDALEHVLAREGVSSNVAELGQAALNAA